MFLGNYTAKEEDESVVTTSARYSAVKEAVSWFSCADQCDIAPVSVHPYFCARFWVKKKKTIKSTDPFFEWAFPVTLCWLPLTLHSKLMRWKKLYIAFKPKSEDKINHVFYLHNSFLRGT